MRKKLAAIAIVAGVGLAASAAFAYWTTGGTGDGGAATGTTEDVVVNQDSVIEDLYPGVPQDLSGDFDNPNPGNVYVSSVTAEVDEFTSQADDKKPACTEADFRINGTSNTPGQIATGEDQGAWSGLSVELINGDGNQDNCKDVDITITYTANA